MQGPGSLLCTGRVPAVRVGTVLRERSQVKAVNHCSVLTGEVPSQVCTTAGAMF